VPVVINDFEVLSEPQPEARKAVSDAANAAPLPAKTVEPRAICAALRVLEVQALRIWAH
jgi:hypothetical protein